MAFLDEVMVEQISRDARHITPRAVAKQIGLALLAAIGWILYGAGWTTRITVLGVWRAVTWSAVAVRLGWQSAGPPRPKH